MQRISPRINQQESAPVPSIQYEVAAWLRDNVPSRSLEILGIRTV